MREIRMPPLVEVAPDDLNGTLARLGRFLGAIKDEVGYTPQPWDVTFHPSDCARVMSWLVGSWGGRPLRGQLTSTEAAWLLLHSPLTDASLKEGTLLVAVWHS